MARQLEEQLLALQREGQATFTEVLRARERRFEIEAAEINARRDYNMAKARHLGQQED
jgi:outer membrane protein TolC